VQSIDELCIANNILIEEAALVTKH
jgi:hypothetical protein